MTSIVINLGDIIVDRITEVVRKLDISEEDKTKVVKAVTAELTNNNEFQVKSTGTSNKVSTQNDLELKPKRTRKVSEKERERKNDLPTCGDSGGVTASGLPCNSKVGIKEKGDLCSQHRKKNNELKVKEITSSTTKESLIPTQQSDNKSLDTPLLTNSMVGNETSISSQTPTSSNKVKFADNIRKFQEKRALQIQSENEALE
jgi:hypothetical protein